MADGTRLTVRPTRPEDEPMMVKFHRSLSEQSVYLRYFNSQSVEQRISHERLTRSCFIDYDREMALVAERQNAETGEREIIGVSRLIRSHTDNTAELAAVVTDAFQRREIGLALMTQLVDFARDEKLDRVIAIVLLENRGMRAVLERAGFLFCNTTDFNVLTAELQLRDGSPSDV